MQEHLTDEQLAELLDGNAGPDAREHLTLCPACRDEQEQLRRALVRYARTATAAAERAEGFWQRQQASIAARLTQHPVPRRLAWAAAAASVALAAILLIGRTPQPAPKAEVDPDSALLVDVERSVKRELPQALEPAALLAQELSRSSEARSNP